MDSKDLAVLRKIRQHTVSTLRYCAVCQSLTDFDAGPIRTEAVVFNLMQIGELAKAALSDQVKM